MGGTVVSEFLLQWWVLSLGLGLPAIWGVCRVVWIWGDDFSSGASQMNIAAAIAGVSLSTAVLFGLVALHLFYGRFEAVLGKPSAEGAYLVLLGTVLLLSHYVPHKSIVLRWFAEVVYVMTWPRSRQNTLAWGVAIIVIGAASAFLRTGSYQKLWMWIH